MRYFCIFFLLFLTGNVYAQLGFCQGSKGDFIFHEDFGTGNQDGPALPAGVTSYTYTTGDPDDGSYAISNQVGQYNTSWHSYFPGTTVSNGKALKVNADDNTSGQFFEKEILGLCENTSYEFSAYLINLYDRDNSVCENGGIPINVRFEIWDETDSNLLRQGSTGDIHSTSSPKWEQYALTFQSEAGQDAVILKMFNNGVGGCGNDLAIDDIVFRSCGDLTEITSAGIDGNELSVCEPDAPVSLDLTATPDFSVYDDHAFQWQESDDNIDWQDVPGEKNGNFTTPALSTSKYYRVKVAEDEVNLSDDLCSSASEAFYFQFIPTPEAPVSNGNEIICSNDNLPVLTVNVGDDETVNWYDAETGGSLLKTGAASYLPEAAGTFYAEAVKTDTNCEASSRTAVSLTINQSPQVEDEQLELCENGQLLLDAGIENMSYLWSSGEITKSIKISNPGIYKVTVTSADNCSSTKTFEVSAVSVAGIKSIVSEGNSVTIEPLYDGNFEYSLNGTTFQSSNVFESVSGGVYTAYIRDLSGCNTVTEEFPHILVPKFITPNGDGYNDHFKVNGLEFYDFSEIRIFDRYGKLLKSGRGENFAWNGKIKGKDLPASDFWYEISIENYEVIKGNFSLKR